MQGGAICCLADTPRLCRTKTPSQVTAFARRHRPEDVPERVWLMCKARPLGAWRPHPSQPEICVGCNNHGNVAKTRQGGKSNTEACVSMATGAYLRTHGTSCIACHAPSTWHTPYGTQGPTKQGPMCPYPVIHQIAKNPPWQAPPDRLQTLPQDSWAMRPRRSAAGASRHGGPLTRRKLSPLQNSMSASQQPLRSPVSGRVLPSIHIHVCSAATWHCAA